MKRRAKIHLMAEHDRMRARCQAIVSVTRLTDAADKVTCVNCLPAGEQKRVVAYLSSLEAKCVLMPGNLDAST